MKLSKRTMSILKNFSTINPSIQFKKGKVLKTVSPSKTLLGKAKLDHDIDGTFAIYDLGRLLALVSMMDDPDFEIHENYVSIGNKANYRFADPELIIAPPDKDIEITNYEVEVDITADQYNEIVRAMGIMGFPNVMIVGEDGKIKLRAADVKNPTTDKYDIEIGTTEKEFSVVFNADNLKIIEGDYKVYISAPKGNTPGLAHFKGDDVEYWAALEITSKF